MRGCMEEIPPPSLSPTCPPPRPAMRYLCLVHQEVAEDSLLGHVRERQHVQHSGVAVGRGWAPDPARKIAPIGRQAVITMWVESRHSSCMLATSARG